MMKMLNPLMRFEVTNSPMTNRISSFASALGAVALALSSSAHGLEMKLLDDSYSALGYPTSACGNQVTLRVSGLTSGANRGMRTHLKFDFSTSLPSGFSYSQVSKATLRLYVNKVTTAGQVNLFAVTSGWDEATLTENNKPSLAATAATSQTVAVVDKYVDFDVTSLVQGWLNSPSPYTNNGIALLPNDTATFVEFDSKEATANSHPPELHVVLTNPPGPSVTSGSGSPTGPGNVGDFYIDTTNNRIYGPRTATGYATTYTALVGPQGSPGLNGVAGASLRTGNGLPSGYSDGDSYIDLGTARLYGPKAGGTWPTAFKSLVGPQGPPTTRIVPQGDLSMGTFTVGTAP